MVNSVFVSAADMVLHELMDAKNPDDMSRYPFYQLDINDQLPVAECRAVEPHIADLTARVDGNNSGLMK